MNKNIFHILVVDDDDRIRELVKQYLEENQFLVTTAKDAIEAKKKIEIVKFDILVLDIMMPGESGLSLTQEVKKYNPTPIILLTAKGEVDSRQRQIFLNEKGKKFFEEIFMEQKKRIYNAFKDSDSDEVIKFKNVLNKIINEQR